MTEEQFIKCYNEFYMTGKVQITDINQIADWENKKAFIEHCIHMYFTDNYKIGMDPVIKCIPSVEFLPQRENTFLNKMSDNFDKMMNKLRKSTNEGGDKM